MEAEASCCRRHNVRHHKTASASVGRVAGGAAGCMCGGVQSIVCVCASVKMQAVQRMMWVGVLAGKGAQGEDGGDTECIWW